MTSTPRQVIVENQHKRLVSILDIFLLPFVYPAAWLLKGIRKAGVQRLPLCRNALLNVGVFPIRNHYYEPQFDLRETRRDLSEARNLPGIDWNIEGQLALLSELTFADELAELPRKKPTDLQFYLDNETFESGDAEYWYQLIRKLKPTRIFEIGSGFSTLMAIRAIKKNQQENPEYQCKHICVEPYEQPWLEETGVSVMRKRVEQVDISFFSELAENDILFIDSSHMIRPDGDVLFEYLQLLPTLRKGVIVHVHDIFSPRNYPDKWLRSEIRFWNEQYLLEAFLSHNSDWKVIGALNYLNHDYHDQLKASCPFLTPDREPGSFYIQKCVHIVQKRNLL